MTVLKQKNPDLLVYILDEKLKAAFGDAQVVAERSDGGIATSKRISNSRKTTNTLAP